MNVKIRNRKEAGEMSTLKNNLFYYATKELSQDAFICWLCSHALTEADSDDLELIKCAKNLVCAFFEKHFGSDICPEEVSLRCVERQVEHVDVLLTAEYQGKAYKIIIEDKINTSEHDNQLVKYKENLENKGCNVIGIYFKTGFQSDMSNVEAAGYKLFNRSDILEILEACNSENAILKDYKLFWKNFEEVAQSYKSMALDKWPDWQTVNGFYDEIQSDIVNREEFWAGYGWVSNRSGGFWGLWYGLNEDKICLEKFSANLYLQMETKWDYSLECYKANIVLKFESDSKDDGEKSLREYIILEQENFGFVKPNKIRKGAHMTIGKYNVELNNANYIELKEQIIEAANKYKELLAHIKTDYK